ncbi:MAG: DUF1269 domain-containing protein [Acidimicrobiales bacterium]
MADLIAIGYPGEKTADEAEAELLRLAADLVLEPEAIAVISRDDKGRFHVRTTHHQVARGATWGLLWGFLFGVLFFIPIFGLAVGAGLGALIGLVEKLDMSRAFQDRVRDMLQPGTAALFVVAEKVTSDRVEEALSHYHGTVLKTSLSHEAERQLQEALSGGGAPAAAPSS